MIVSANFTSEDVPPEGTSPGQDGKLSQKIKHGGLMESLDIWHLKCPG